MHKAWIGALAVVAASVTASCSIGADLPLARQAVEKSRQDMGAGRNAAVWRGATSEFRQVTAEGDWVKLIDAVNVKLGKFRSATETGWNDNFNNGRHYIVINYNSTYERGAAAEQFVYQIIDGRAVLAGYHVSSNALITN